MQISFKTEGSYVYSIFDIVRNAVLRELGGGAKFPHRRTACRRSSRANLDAERKPAHWGDYTTDAAYESADVGDAEREQAVWAKFVADAQQRAPIDFTGEYAEHGRITRHQSGKSQLDDGSLPDTNRDTGTSERIESGEHIQF